METAIRVFSTSEVLAEIERLLGAVDHSARGLATDAERLQLLQTAVRVAGQGAALTQQLAGEVVATEAAEHAHGTSAGSWLAETTLLTRKEASALLCRTRAEPVPCGGGGHPRRCRAPATGAGDQSRAVRPA